MLRSLGPELPKERRSISSYSRSPSHDMVDLLPLPEPFLGEISTSREPRQAAVFDEISLAATPRSAEIPCLGAFQSGVELGHPFHNYWTKDGGLAEVVSILPDRPRALQLVASYFDSVDPLYPMLSRGHIIAEVEHFQHLSFEEKHSYNAAKLALHFIIYAAGAFFIPEVEPEERASLSDLYLSASHQCLCLCSYLSQFSLETAQVILLIGYLLINTNRVSEAWTFSGILVRQAYALRLHRNSTSHRDSILRRRLWQAVVVQDVSIAYHLDLPPSVIHCIDMRAQIDELGHHSDHDLDYESAMWQWATFVKEHICNPRATEGPIASSSYHKETIISQYREMYESWRPPFNSQSPKRFEFGDLRLARQLITVSSSFFGVLTVLYLDQNLEAGVLLDIHGAIDATHEAMSSFFALLRLFPDQMDMWASYHTRAYAQAMRIARILVSETQHLGQTSRDPRLMIGKSDLDRYLDILLSSRGSHKHQHVQHTRFKALREVVDMIGVA
ncbi:hypothetical protein CB0940_09164 [Cercospora beticola]|uniref:Xylanolytic transcriptional activator regulatory domain-containing protein n=1 Tax=Cercospora beticola TaxID=122368 RepID=A0A2G5HIN1_CERBT|nr:hypothetical protein CB0940_09164 [Cercospora beticola]PIA92398.1 hypothetical protein CB0940_09164 [Cercospora beticola]WPB06548.1 hypothetical protein RHO25_011205 [Cercospora beticola]